MVVLDWTTQQELNNDKFLIQHSTDGREYLDIGDLKGKGTTTLPHDYHFTDEHPASGTNYYRLKQMDFDGNFEYSPVQSVAIQREGELLIYPTITHGELQLQLPESAVEETLISIYSMQGALLQQQLLEGTGTLTVVLPEIPSGQYVVEVINGNTTKSSLIFKQ